MKYYIIIILCSPILFISSYSRCILNRTIRRRGRIMESVREKQLKLKQLREKLQKNSNVNASDTTSNNPPLKQASTSSSSDEEESDSDDWRFKGAL